jgi:hypothetical protein
MALCHQTKNSPYDTPEYQILFGRMEGNTTDPPPNLVKI